MQRAIGTTTHVNGEKNVNPGTTCFQRLNNHVLVRLHHRILQVQARTVTTKSVSYSTEEQSIREFGARFRAFSQSMRPLQIDGMHEQ